MLIFLDFENGDLGIYPIKSIWDLFFQEINWLTSKQMAFTFSVYMYFVPKPLPEKSHEFYLSIEFVVWTVHSSPNFDDYQQWNSKISFCGILRFLCCSKWLLLVTTKGDCWPTVLQTRRKRTNIGFRSQQKRKFSLAFQSFLLLMIFGVHSLINY